MTVSDWRRKTKRAVPWDRPFSNSYSGNLATRRTRTETAALTATGACASTEGRLRRLGGEKAFALQFLAGELARAAHGFRLFAGFLFGRLFVVAAQLHFAENALTLHLFLKRFESLIDVIVANENLHVCS
jgi:hypothetical protein